MGNYREEWFANNKSDHGWYTCAKCGKKMRKGDVDIDHIIPQKRRGPDSLWNLQCMCKHCNRSKQASVKETVPDLVKTNKQRVVKGAKKVLQSAAKAVVGGVKTAIKKAVKKKR